MIAADSLTGVGRILYAIMKALDDRVCLIRKSIGELYAAFVMHLAPVLQ
jgi:hypothetical protein